MWNSERKIRVSNNGIKGREIRYYPGKRGEVKRVRKDNRWTCDKKTEHSTRKKSNASSKKKKKKEEEEEIEEEEDEEEEEEDEE